MLQRQRERCSALNITPKLIGEQENKNLHMQAKRILVVAILREGK